MPVFHFGDQLLKPRTAAWTEYAISILDAKQCAMGGTLDMGVLSIQKLVRYPFERNAGVRTAVTVGIDSITTAYYQYCNLTVTLPDIHTA